METFSTTPGGLDYGHAELFRTHPFRRVRLWELEGRVDGVHLLPADNHITALDLIGNDLSVQQLKKLVKVTRLPHLRELGLMFNGLRDTSVKVLCGEPFFQKLDLIRLGANPFTTRGRDQLRAHFGGRVTFAHEREPDRLYTLKDERLRAGWGKGFTQLFMRAGAEQPFGAVFDHAGNLLRTGVRAVPPASGHADREANRVSVRDAWLGYTSATVEVKVFTLPEGTGLTPFNWWANVFVGTEPEPHHDFRRSVSRWFEDGQYRVDFGTYDNWFDRTGEVTDT